MIVLTAHFLAVVVVALLFTIATLQSENSDLRNVVRVRWTDTTITS